MEAKLILNEKVEVALVELQKGQKDNQYRGHIKNEQFPVDLVELFLRFQEYVEDQIFDLADEISERILSYKIRVCFEEIIDVFELSDLQVFEIKSDKPKITLEILV